MRFPALKYLLTILLVSAALADDSITTVQFDRYRTGANSAEKRLTPANVTTGKFGKLGTYSVTGKMFNQVLYTPGVTIGGVSKRLAIVATQSDWVNAFDGNNPGSAAIWSTHVATHYSGSMGIGFLGSMGCQPTPATDLTYIYALCMTSTPAWVLYKLDITDGSVVSSVTVSGTFGAATFDASIQTSKTGLTLANGRVYFGFGALFEAGESYHGWIFAYDTSAMTRVAVFNCSPNSLGCGIWQSGGGFPVDDDGNIYAATGNGEYDPSNDSYGQSLLKLDPDLNLLDWFAPSNYAATNAVDADLSSGKPILIPGSSKVVIAGKDFWVYVVNINCMGHLQGSGFGGCTQQSFQTDSSTTMAAFTGSFGSMFLLGSTLYLPLNAGPIYAFAWDSGTETFNTTPSIRGGTYGNPGAAQISGSSYGSTNGIIWTARTTGTSSAHSTLRAGTLSAIDTNLNQLWTSDLATGDTLGNLAKYASPTIVDGKVFIPTQSGTVEVYGHRPSVVLRGGASLRNVSQNLSTPTTGFTHHRALTLDHLQAGSADSTNWKFLFYGTYSYLKTVANGGDVQSSSAYDVAFSTLSNCSTILPFEQVSHNGATGAVQYWVNIPTLSHTSDTTIYLCYGDSSLSSSLADTATLWSNYSGVWHLESVTGTGLYDSSANGRNLTNQTTRPDGSGSSGPATATTGNIGGGIVTPWVKGSDEGITTGRYTISAWLKTTTSVNPSMVVEWRSGTGTFFHLGSYDGHFTCALSQSASATLHDWINGTSDVNDGAWHYCVMEFGDGTAQVYIDGALQASGSRSFESAVETGIKFGQAQDNLPFAGSMDEVRVTSNIKRAASWVTADYNNQKPSSTFYTVGSDF